MRMHEEAEKMRRSGRVEAAVRFLNEEIARGNGQAALTLALWRVHGDTIRRDLAEATRLFSVAAGLGCVEAEEPYAALLASGAGQSTREWNLALEQLRKRTANDAFADLQLRLLSRMAVDDQGEPAQEFAPRFICQDPLVVAFDAFLTDEECDALIMMAETKFAPSRVINPATGKLVSNPVRTSYAAAFPLVEENPFLHAINRRIAAASRSRYEQGEPTQILSYVSGQEYKLHSDAIAGESNQRIQTFLIYLTDDFAGGETHFPAADLKLRPAKGGAICFSNVTADMEPARTSVHAGLPVTAGRKIVLSKWIRRYPLDLAGPPGKPF